MIIDDYDDSPTGFLFRYITMRCTGYLGRMSFVMVASNSIPSSGALNASSSVSPLRDFHYLLLQGCWALIVTAVLISPLVSS